MITAKLLRKIRGVTGTMEVFRAISSGLNVLFLYYSAQSPLDRVNCSLFKDVALTGPLFIVLRLCHCRHYNAVNLTDGLTVWILPTVLVAGALVLLIWQATSVALSTYPISVVGIIDFRSFICGATWVSV